MIALAKTLAKVGKSEPASAPPPPAESVKSELADPTYGRLGRVLALPAIAGLSEDVKSELGKHFRNVYAIPGKSGARLENFTPSERKTWEQAWMDADSRLRKDSQNWCGSKPRSAAGSAITRAGLLEAWDRTEKQLRAMTDGAMRAAGIHSPGAIADVQRAVVLKAESIILKDFDYPGKTDDERYANRLMDALFAGYIPRGSIGNLVYVCRAELGAAAPREPEPYCKSSAPNQSQEMTPKKKGHVFTLKPAEPLEAKTPFDHGMWNLEEQTLPAVQRPSLRVHTYTPRIRVRDKKTPEPAKDRSTPVLGVPRELALTVLLRGTKIREELSVAMRESLALYSAITPPATPAGTRKIGLKSPALTPEQKTRLLNLAKGDPALVPRKAAEELGIGIYQTRRFLRESGFRRTRGRPSTLKAKQIRKIRKLRAAGKTDGEIIARVGAKPTVVARLLRKEKALQSNVIALPPAETRAAESEASGARRRGRPSLLTKAQQKEAWDMHLEGRKTRDIVGKLTDKSEAAVRAITNFLSKKKIRDKELEAAETAMGEASADSEKGRGSSPSVTA